MSRNPDEPKFSGHPVRGSSLTVKAIKGAILPGACGSSRRLSALERSARFEALSCQAGHAPVGGVARLQFSFDQSVMSGLLFVSLMKKAPMRDGTAQATMSQTGAK